MKGGGTLSKTKTKKQLKDPLKKKEKWELHGAQCGVLWGRKQELIDVHIWEFCEQLWGFLPNIESVAFAKFSINYFYYLI